MMCLKNSDHWFKRFLTYKPTTLKKEPNAPKTKHDLNLSVINPSKADEYPSIGWSNLSFLGEKNTICKLNFDLENEAEVIKT